MSNRKPQGEQVDTISHLSPFVQESFDLRRLDAFTTGLGVDFLHYKALPSPIGQANRGDYRRNDGVDTVSSNGFIYMLAGKFTAAITDDSRRQKRTQVSLLDPSESHLVMPRFYNKTEVADGDRIYLVPGDRIYVADKNADVMVGNYQKMDYDADKDNVPLFPIVKMELPIVDSRNQEYREHEDFVITDCGNIRWLPEGKNPGIDPSTGKGRIYAIRYLYKAFWYVTTLLKEIRISNVTDGCIRKPERMPYSCVIVREYVYHNQNRGGETDALKSKTPQRRDAEPIESIKESPVIPVNMQGIENPGDDKNNLKE